MTRFSRPLAISLLAATLLLTLAGTALAQTAARATLTARAGQTVNGTATLSSQGSQTVVTVRITNGPPNSTHVNHIHTGTCEAEGGIVYPLTDLRTDASGTATGTTTINATVASLTGGNNYVNVHAGPSLPSPGTTCGNIVSGAAALPATGVGASAHGASYSALVYPAFATLVALCLIGVGYAWRRVRA